MMNRFKLIVTASIFAFSYSAQARENVPGGATSHSNQTKSVMALCAPAAAKEDLDINNIRATILTGGDMWWDLQNGKYLVPKPAKGSNGPTSLFAGSLWIGGIDASNTLKVAAMTYRQTGNDFWPGPLSSLAITDATTCLTWDKFYKIDKSAVQSYIGWFDGGQVGANPTDASMMDVILNWPSTGPEGQPMAPYYDRNGNGVYDPYAGDYPDFYLGDGTRPTNNACSARLFGDEVLFWVFNDKGNVHTETGGAAIGLEVQAQAFAFQTNNEINNMTFYHYTLINKSSFRLDSTYFGVWVDPDLGSASDDYVGCDVELGLGYCYNGDLVDDNPPSGQIPYGVNPPAIGCDFFEGPYADPNGVDDAPATVPASFTNYGDSIVDNERIGMSKFVYYNNDNSLTGNPGGATDFYQYLAGVWRDGTPITYGGTGHLTGVTCNYMFPGTSDPTGFGTGGSSQAPWDEASVGNVPADRRFLQSAGSFTLQPGSVNTITTGLVWARATQGGNLASVTLMKGADAKAQDLFNNCFALLSGPDAPNLSIQELDHELILTWTNPTSNTATNNVNETYSEDYDKSSGADSLYRFQGYMVYQLKDETVTPADFYNPDKARLVLQCDKADGVKQIVNFTYDLSLQALVPQEMVNGNDKGLVHSLSVTEDKFAVGNARLVNHKTYYFAIVAYGYSPTLVLPNYSIPKDYLPFIAGNKSADGTNGFIHAGIPHNPAPENGGTEAHSTYGTGPKLTRIEGHGNGGNILDLTSGSTNEIIANGFAKNPVYENSRGPVAIKVVDPLSVPDDQSFKFTLKAKYGTTGATAFSPQDSSRWTLTNLNTGDVVYSDKTIAIANEQIINGQPTGISAVSIPKWGISVNIAYTTDPGTATSINNGFLEGTMSFADDTKQWLTGMPDEEGPVDANWIRSGAATFTAPDNVYNDAAGVGTDANQNYENIINKTWAPYRLCATGTTAAITATSVYAKGAPAWPTNISLNKLSNLASVNVIITSDQSQWTRCPVLEEQDDPALAYGGAKKLHMRASQSVDKNGNPAALGSGTSTNPSDPNYNGEKGMGWFPGYAINLETGERLNMAFGEDSWLVTDHGNDMKWNPTGSRYATTGDPSFGGKHYIYVFGHNADAVFAATDALLPGQLKDIPRYDGGRTLHNILEAAANATITSAQSDAYKREVFTDAMWVNIPLLAAGHSLFETTVAVRLRVAKSYQKGYSSFYISGGISASPDTAAAPANLNYPQYTFNTADIETHTNDADIAKSALDLINVVPNPYYAHSEYERTALSNIVKITNLPQKATISIYTLNGTLIRTFNKDDTKNSLDWDLKNAARIPIASGMYIIHIKVPDVGEKTLKWFGVLRPIDLESY
ncbi:MAG: T9SS type A sorting domain-containing protein [Bacteroidia bacterium]